MPKKSWLAYQTNCIDEKAHLYICADTVGITVGTCTTSSVLYVVDGVPTDAATTSVHAINYVLVPYIPYPQAVPPGYEAYGLCAFGDCSLCRHAPTEATPGPNSPACGSNMQLSGGAGYGDVAGTVVSGSSSPQTFQNYGGSG